jgi:hypothetical protein
MLTVRSARTFSSYQPAGGTVALLLVTMLLGLVAPIFQPNLA